jgi:hypothetical protein
MMETVQRDVDYDDGDGGIVALLGAWFTIWKQYVP